MHSCDILHDTDNTDNTDNMDHTAAAAAASSSSSDNIACSRALAAIMTRVQIDHAVDELLPGFFF